MANGISTGSGSVSFSYAQMYEQQGQQAQREPHRPQENVVQELLSFLINANRDQDATGVNQGSMAGDNGVAPSSSSSSSAPGAWD